MSTSAFEGRDERVLVDALDLELDLGERRVAVDPADGGQRADPTAERGHRVGHAGQRRGRSTMSNRIAAVSTARRLGISRASRGRQRRVEGR